MNSSLHKNWVTEAVHVYTFEVSSGEFSTTMETAAASEGEARKHIKDRLDRCGVQRDIALVSVRFNVYRRTRTLRVSS
jgi:hypothetical protein